MKHGGYKNIGNDQNLYSQSTSQSLVSAQRSFAIKTPHPPPLTGRQPIPGLLPAVCHRNPIIHLGEERQSEASFLSKNTTSRQIFNPQINIFVQSTDLKFKVLTELAKPVQSRKSGSSEPL